MKHFVYDKDTNVTCSLFRHQVQHYTGQLAKDTSKHLKDLNNFSGEQRQWRLQKERLHNDFTKALNSFQAAQRTAAQREKEVIKRAKAASGINGETIHWTWTVSKAEGHKEFRNKTRKREGP